MAQAKSIPLLKLNNGKTIPQIGLGTWKSQPGQVSLAVQHAISAGYRHIDGAFIYQNEDEVGDGINMKMNDGTVKREDLFVVSKVWNTFHSRAKVKECVELSLEKLKLKYIDLLHIHWPMGYLEGGPVFPKDDNGKFQYSDVDYLETWKGMEDCVKLGLAHSLGLSNCNSDQIQRVIDHSEIKPSVVQVECHPYMNQSNLLRFCKERDIIFTAYSPLGSPDRPWAKPEDPSLLDEGVLLAMGKKYGKSVAQVLIRYQVQRGVVVTPKSVTPGRIDENIQVFDFELSSEDMKVIDGFNRPHRFVELGWVNDHPYYPFHTPY